ncbi:MAG: F0F1 ATP synthase subunit A [Metamycoplasmataceae bacterium]
MSDSVFTQNLWQWNQPQMISLIYTFLVLCILSFIIYFKVKKSKVEEAPKGIVFFAEQYVGVFNREFNSISAGNIDRVGPYIFTLFSFLIVGNTTSLVGLEPVTSSYSVPLMLGVISWIGIYVLGIFHRRMHFFKKYLNPVELISQFSPLISISFRIYGNILGGSILMFLIYALTGKIWGFIPVIGEINLLGMIVAPWFHIYFDLFEASIQAYVFSLLTCIYWSTEVENGIELKEKKKNKLKLKEQKKEENIIILE